MAEKDKKPKNTAKTDTTSAKSASKPAETAKPASTKATKSATKSEAKPAAKPEAKSVTKPEAKPAAAEKPKTSTAAKKPAVKTEDKSAATKPTPAPATKSEAAKTEKASKADVTASKSAKETAVAADAVQKPNKAAATTAKPESKEKPAKAQKGDSSGKAATVALSKNKIRLIAIVAVALLCIAALVLGLVFGLKSCSLLSSDDFNPVSELERYDVTAYKTSTRVLYSAEVTGTVQRNKPIEEVKNEGDSFNSEATGTIFANGAKRYPTYGSTLNSVIGTDEAQVAARQAIINESGYLCAWGTAGANNGGEQTPDKYTKIDKNGYLYQYKDNQWINSLVWGKTAGEYSPENYRQLYKHSAAQGMYMEGYTKNGVKYEIADDATRVIKEISMQKRGYGYGITGLYAPAGEVVKVELSGKDMNATGGITIHIGQALYNGQANNIWVSKNQMQRFPYLLTTLTLNKNTCEYNEETDTWTGYIGSFIGGPIYIRSNVADFTAKISGGVEYLHFVLGYTTEAEFNRLKETSRVPMFDLEVWDRGVLLSGPRYYAETFSYEDLYKAAVLWDKVSSVTAAGDGSTGIVFLFDPFVAAGAAVAFPGRSSVNCPAGWMPQALNYNSLVTSGSWGNFHEYHHNFQNYGLGVGADGEVTNNGLNLVSYSLFTKISSNRGINSYGGQGLGGWNNYTSAPWVIQRVNAGQIDSTNGLAIYATLLHNFGQDAYINARGYRGVNYLNRWQNITHQDLSYFASQINAYANLTPETTNYPLFVPVASVYQTGRSYMYDNEKRDIKTMQPYVIPYGEKFTVDLRPYTAPNGQYASGSIVIGSGFTYTIKSVTKPSNGKLEETDEKDVYKYIPDTNSKQMLSGQIRVTLSITADPKSTYASREINDVDLILEFEQTHETNKMKIQRTTYTYAAENMYTDAVTAYENGFAGYTGEPVTQNQFNPTQNVNTDIWFRPDTDKAHQDYPNEPDKYFIHDNRIDVLDGKLYFDSDGTHRVYLRGRDNCAVYFSLNGKDYTLGARITESTPTNGATANFRVNAPETYFDVKFEEGKVTVTTHIGEDKTSEYTLQMNANKSYENWLYVKEVLIDHKSPNVSFIGLGTNQWVQAMFTVQETYHRADNKTVDSEEYKDYAYTKTTYFNQNNTEVAYTRKDKGSTVLQYYKKVGKNYYESNADEVAKLTETKLIEPASANYVNAYRSTYEFPDNKSFETDYFYVRSYDYDYNDFTPKDAVTVIETNYKPEGWGNGMPITNISDSKTNTYIHTSWSVSANKPLNLTFDLGGERRINRIIFQCRNNNGMLETPKAFIIEGSLDGITWFDVATFTNAPRNGNEVTADFNVVTLRFCKISISAAHQGNGSYYIVIGEITFTYAIPNAKLISPDDDILNYSGTWNGAQATSTFGHIIVGNKNSTVSFEFEGTRLGILTSTAYGKDFEVVIDGKVVNSTELKEDTSETFLTYLCEPLENGKHTVTIKCKGEANIDSIALYP